MEEWKNGRMGETLDRLRRGLVFTPQPPNLPVFHLRHISEVTERSEAAFHLRSPPTVFMTSSGVMASMHWGSSQERFSQGRQWSGFSTTATLPK